MGRMIPTLQLSGTSRFCLLMGLIIVLAQSGGQTALDILRWDRVALTEFDWWRLWTGHLIHASWPHVGLNLMGLVLIAWLFPEPKSLREHCLRFAWLALFISVAMFSLPDLGWYVGLSGVLHGSFVFGLWWLWRRGDRLALVLLLGLLFKLGWEHLHGPLTSDEDLVGVPVLTQAHSFGAIGAGIWLAAAAAFNAIKQGDSST